MLTGCNLAAGSYPYVENYEANGCEQEVTEALLYIKRNSSNLQPLNLDSTAYYFTLRDENNRMDFYDKEKQQIFFIKIGPEVANAEKSSLKKTSIGLVAVNKEMKSGADYWKNVNTNKLSKLENREVKERFESLILRPLERYMQEKRESKEPILFRKKYKWWTFWNEYEYVELLKYNNENKD